MCTVGAVRCVSHLACTAFVGPRMARTETATIRRQAGLQDLFQFEKGSSSSSAPPQQDLIADVIATPERLSKEAQDAVERTLDTFRRDDGRVLDTSSPAGSVGAAAVSLAVLPYIPLSFYSSYLVLTTGSGLEPGPYNIYGLAEGLATLAIWAVVLWSLTSFVTRTRGLPAGPLNLLAITQALSYVAALALVGASYLAGTWTPPDVDKLMSQGQSQLSSGVKGLQSSSSTVFADLTKDFGQELAALKKQADEEAAKLASEAQSKVSKAVEAQKAALEVIIPVPAFPPVVSPAGAPTAPSATPSSPSTAPAQIEDLF